jgi:twitching motility two-component system response regulator PilG
MEQIQVSDQSSNPIRVLVVDDSQTIRRSAELFLARAGYQVTFAEDGFDALSKVVDFSPDIVFIDVMMPRLDGYQACALIKRNRKFSSTAVVMLSSKDSVFDRARGRSVGCDEYLTKPFSKEMLLQAVQQHARRDIANSIN